MVAGVCRPHKLKLFKSGIGWGGTDAVNNLTALQAANWEPRAQVTVRVLYETTDVSTINAILTTSIIVENERGDMLETIPAP